MGSEGSEVAEGSRMCNKQPGVNRGDGCYFLSLAPLTGYTGCSSFSGSLSAMQIRYHPLSRLPPFNFPFSRGDDAYRFSKNSRRFRICAPLRHYSLLITHSTLNIAFLQRFMNCALHQHSSILIPNFPNRTRMTT